MAAKQLTGKQKLFVIHYVASLNGTKAARLAGYKGDNNALAVIAHENLRKTNIRAAIDELLNEQAMSSTEVLARLSAQGRADMGDFAHIVTADDLAQHPLSRLVKEFEITRTIGKNGEIEQKIKLKLYDAQAALVHLGRNHQLFTERVEVIDWRSKLLDKGLNPDAAKEKAVQQFIEMLQEEARKQDAESNARSHTAGT